MLERGVVVSYETVRCVAFLEALVNTCEALLISNLMSRWPAPGRAVQEKSAPRLPRAKGEALGKPLSQRTVNDFE